MEPHPDKISVYYGETIGFRPGLRSITGVKIIINNNVKKIHKKAMSRQYNLSQVEFQTPCILRVIESHAFCGCSNLLIIELPEGLDKIEDSAFATCRKLRYITLPSTLTYIGENAFYDCCLRSDLRLPSRLQYIGDHAFGGANIFRSMVTLPRTLVEINSKVFGDSTVHEHDMLENQVFQLMRLPRYSLKVLSLAAHYQYFSDCEQKLRTCKVINMINALAENNTIEQLDLSCNLFNDIQMKKIMKVLHKCPKLKKIILNHNKFTSTEFLLAGKDNQSRI